MNSISESGLSYLASHGCEVGPDVENPDGMLIRSADLHEMAFDPELLAISRAGAGYNNIPVEECAEKGIVVFNSPGANAQAVPVQSNGSDPLRIEAKRSRDWWKKEKTPLPVRN